MRKFNNNIEEDKFNIRAIDFDAKCSLAHKSIITIFINTHTHTQNMNLPIFDKAHIRGARKIFHSNVHIQSENFITQRKLSRFSFRCMQCQKIPFPRPKKKWHA